MVHHGRGRGEYADLEYPAHWVADVDAAMAEQRERLQSVWQDAARGDRTAPEALADRLRPIVRDALREVLRRRFPDARVLATG